MFSLDVFGNDKLSTDAQSNPIYFASFSPLVLPWCSYDMGDQVLATLFSPHYWLAVLQVHLSWEELPPVLPFTQIQQIFIPSHISEFITLIRRPWDIWFAENQFHVITYDKIKMIFTANYVFQVKIRPFSSFCVTLLNVFRLYPAVLCDWLLRHTRAIPMYPKCITVMGVGTWQSGKDSASNDLAGADTSIFKEIFES